MFGGVTASLHIILDGEDSPNSAGVVVDAIRAAKVIATRNLVHKANAISAYLMKAPMRQLAERDAYEQFEEIFA